MKARVFCNNFKSGGGHLYGLESINASNGWAISIVGISIVFSGLVSLSLVISQLYKVLALYEDPSKITAFFKSKKSKKVDEKEGEKIITIVLTRSQKETVKQFALLARTLDDHFSLPRLLHLAQISGIKDPYPSLNILLKMRIVESDENGFFMWKNEVSDRAVR